MARRDELMKEALKLPAQARAELAATLLQSLDDEPDDAAEYEQSWSDEIAHRLREIDSGSVTLLSEDEALRIIDSDDPNSQR